MSLRLFCRREARGDCRMDHLIVQWNIPRGVLGRLIGGIIHILDAKLSGQRSKTLASAVYITPSLLKQNGNMLNFFRV